MVLSRILKARTFFKRINNVLKIDNRISNYKYDIETNNICVYMFDSQYNCRLISMLNNIPVDLEIDRIFPSDMINFFNEIIEFTIKNRSQKIHAIINNKHVFYESEVLLDYNQRLLGIIINEIPFNMIESLDINELEKQKILKDNTMSYILNLDNIIIGIQNSYLLKKNLLYKNIKNEIQTTKIVDIYNNFYNYIIEKDNLVKFYCFADNENLEKKIIVKIFKISIIENLNQKNNSLIFINSEIKHETELKYKNEYLKYPICSNENINNNNIYKICIVCKSILSEINEHLMKDIKQQIIQYNNNIIPIIDDDLPVFGQRSKLGMISFRSMELYKSSKKIWINADKWLKLKIKENNNKITYDICELCYDEFSYYFENILQ